MNLSNKLKVGQIFGNPDVNNYLAIIYLHEESVSFIQNGEIITMGYTTWNKSYRADDDFITCRGSDLERKFIKTFFDELEKGYTF